MNLQAALEQRAKVEEFQRKHRIGLLTLLFTDLVGSTQLKQELGDREAVALIQRYRGLVRELLSRFKEGEEIETAGDSFFLVFAKPSDAVQFSLMVQSKLRALVQEVARPLLNRIGLHIGEVVIEERPDSAKPKDLYGLQIDICARMMSLAQGDQILMTRSTFDNARQVLKGQEIEGLNGLQWFNHGPYVMKGVEEPMEICEVGEVGAAVLKPPPDSEKVHRYVSPDAEPVLGWRPAIGQTVPPTQWVLEEKLGEGSFGEVWLGHHQKLKERRVFKFCFRADRVRPLKREVTLFRLMKERLGEHPRIVRLHDVFFDSPPYYLMIDYVDGRDLRTWAEMQGGLDKIPQHIQLEIVAQIADALHAAHEAGVIHRDVKPSNILMSGQCQVTSDEQKEQGSAALESDSSLVTCHSSLSVKLTDFGLGQVTAQEALLERTRSGFTQSILSLDFVRKRGAYLYMAPETMSGQPPSALSDIYSLGVLLYQCVVGDFTRSVTIDSLSAIHDPVLRDDLVHCLAGNPAARFQKAGELAHKLRSLPVRRAALRQRERMLAGLMSAIASLAVGLSLSLSSLGSGLARFSHNVPVEFLNFQRTGGLAPLPPWLELSLLLVVGLAWGIALPRLRIRPALAMGAILMAVVAPATSLIVARMGSRFAWAVASVEIGAAFLGLAFFYLTRTSLRKRLLPRIRPWPVAPGALSQSTARLL